MPELYPLIKLLHVSCVLLSGGIFTLRGLAMLVASPLSQHRGLKRLSYANDSLLLVSGVLLLIALRLSPLTTAWLGLKLGLLPVYIGLGIYALRKGRSRAGRAGFFGAALAVYLYMLGIARAHHPLGPFALF